MTKKKKTTIAKRTSNKPKSLLVKEPRMRKPVEKKYFGIKRRQSQQPKLPSSFNIMRRSVRLLLANWRLFGILALIYGLLTIFLVRGVSGGLGLQDLKTSFQAAFGGSLSSITTSFVLFSTLVGSAGSSNSPSGGSYQVILMLLICLVTIWSLRQVQAGKKIRARDGFYEGTYPLVQFTLVLVTIGLQLTPLAIGNWLYTTVVGNGIATSALEKFSWLLLFIILSFLSLYLICSSIFALFVVTLPGMTPLKALRSAKKLVLYRRWMLIRKVLFLPFSLLILSSVIMIPILIYLTPVAESIFFILTMFGWILSITYLYNLYRELLNE